jgi:hypothetical protein
MSESAWRSVNRAAGDVDMDQNILLHRGAHNGCFRAHVYSQGHELRWNDLTREDVRESD